MKNLIACGIILISVLFPIVCLFKAYYAYKEENKKEERFWNNFFDMFYNTNNKQG